ncbi:tRNA delta(2)-isopentenylpyrophosphate transferase [Coxiella endosymbiont of Amblyomma americanum]|nr:tRNA delta(2)-isopentenylpyrophosphate transferase [Coxiella endosymbiont of Amblyomma americanum]
MKKHIVCVMGPTAIGKTRLAIELTKLWPFEIISVDSAMVYRDFDIGTSKPTIQELEITPHHLINIRNPNHPYSVGQFYKDALKQIKLVHKVKNRIPLLVGGTMLYFYVLQYGLSDLPVAHPMIRKKILKEAEQSGWTTLYKKLKKIDPKSALQINQHDTQRIQRALEVFEITGQPLSNYQNLNRLKAISHCQFINIVLTPIDRKILHENIEKRFDRMLKDGLLKETKQLYKRYLNPNLPAFRTVGYRQALQYLNGYCNYVTMRYRAVVATRQLAKRQLTWLKRWSQAKWFSNSFDDNNMEDLIKSVMIYLKTRLK